ncbi:MAG: hypothetical protein ACE5GF_01285 [Thermodesulfobacteriota bacterium]
MAHAIERGEDVRRYGTAIESQAILPGVYWFSTILKCLVFIQQIGLKGRETFPGGAKAYGAL